MALADIWPQSMGVLPSPYQLANCYIARFAYWYGKFDQNGFVLFVKHGLVMLYLLGKALSARRGQLKFQAFFMISVWMARYFLLDDSGQTHHISTGDVKLLDN